MQDGARDFAVCTLKIRMNTLSRGAEKFYPAFAGSSAISAS